LSGAVRYTRGCNTASRKHGVSFELASTVFNDQRLLTIADVEHSETEERWFSIGLASNGAMLSIAYLWQESQPGATKSALSQRVKRQR